MDVGFLAKDEQQAMAIAHVIAEEIQRTVNDSIVVLGENYRKEETGGNS